MLHALTYNPLLATLRSMETFGTPFWKKPGYKEAFEKHLLKQPLGKKCWIWTGPRLFRQTTPRRISFLLYLGRIPPNAGYWRTTCKTPFCINPDHAKSAKP